MWRQLRCARRGRPICRCCGNVEEEGRRLERRHYASHRVHSPTVHDERVVVHNAGYCVVLQTVVGHEVNAMPQPSFPPSRVIAPVVGARARVDDPELLRGRRRLRRTRRRRVCSRVASHVQHAQVAAHPHRVAQRREQLRQVRCRALRSTRAGNAGNARGASRAWRT